MLVYGDSSVRATFGKLYTSVSAQVGGPEAWHLDGAREALVLAGELEQSTFDLDPAIMPVEWAESVRSLTDRAASQFLDALEGTRLARRPDARAEEVPPDVASIPLQVKTPEGFAFYTLFPEAYRTSASRWLAEHWRVERKRATVIGIRSIGTSLSAVVAETLRRGGWTVQRLTVRPSGHPFDRRVTLGAIDADSWVLIVDEGPGLSGSSIASVAQAACAAGAARGQIAFFPGHAGAPGSHAPEWAREWWAKAPRYATPLGELTWHGRSLRQCLDRRTAEWTGRKVVASEDVSGGQWRAKLYASPAEWPAIAVPFERTKYRVVLDDRSAVLWKFTGLGRPATIHEETTGSPATLRPIGKAFGFTAYPWLDGTPMTKGDPPPDLSTAILLAAGPPLDEEESCEAHARIANMLVSNVRESLGEAASRRAERLCDTPVPPMPRYGDGRLAPHEWLRLPDGRTTKTDVDGHDDDHTLVGPQPIAWDVAGAMVEWCIDTPPVPLPDTILPFYRAAYAAYRLGLMDLCAQGATGDERHRLLRAADFYRSCIAEILDSA